ncbi:MAG: hypothetical protein ACI39H_07035 [Lachnospiraceae bacterium]
MEQEKKAFIGYEYKEVSVSEGLAPMYMDCYENFGWIAEEERHDLKKPNHVILRMKRDRKILNKMELTRLQRNFEACANDLNKLEGAKTTTAIVWALAVGLAGTAFMAGATFAAVHEPPIIWLCNLLAIPGFAGWILPVFVYRKIVKSQTVKLQPLIEDKLDELYAVCEKGHSLL